MNKQIILVLLAAVLTASYAHAQLTFGARAGLNLTNMFFDDEELNDSKMKPGFQIGFVGDYALSDNLSIQPGILFATQGCKWSESYSESIGGVTMKGSSSATLNLNYIQIPVNAQYKYNLGGMNLLLQAGPYFSFGISGKNKWEYTEEWGGNKESDKGEDKIEFGKDGDFKASDFGLGLGVGMQFENIQVGVGYNLGLANIDPDWKAKNNGLALTVTYLFGK